jgi:hypothetical protein
MKHESEGERALHFGYHTTPLFIPFSSFFEVQCGPEFFLESSAGRGRMEVGTRS